MKNISIKKIIVIKTIIIFLSLFLFSNVYRWLPNFITSIFFPVNESLYEHLKMIFNAETIVSLIIYWVLKMKNKKINNYLLASITGTIFNIILFYLIYLPIYYRFGQNLIITMIIYLITLIISQYLFYLITLKKHNDMYNKLSLIIIIFICLLLSYFTYYPLKTEFFFDPIKEIYGIPKKMQ